MNLMQSRRNELWEPMRQLEREMGQIMQRFFGESEGAGQGVTAWAPRVDVEEDDNQYVIKADLPGVDAKDVDISIADNALVLRGQKKEEREEKQKNYHRIERFEGQFYRVIPLPRGVDTDKIQARTENGVLTITIPKAAEAQPRKIEVQSAAASGKSEGQQQRKTGQQQDKAATGK